MIGQVFDTYWMVEYDGKLFIIDQHADHEKVLYEKLMKAFSQKALQKQMLSPPVILTLSLYDDMPSVFPAQMHFLIVLSVQYMVCCQHPDSDKMPPNSHSLY